MSCHRRAAAVAVAFLLSCAVSAAQGDIGERRLVFVKNTLASDQDLERVLRVIELGAGAGYNGVVLTSSFDAIALRPPEYFARLAAVRAACESQGMSIIPTVFSAGWGGGVLAHDCNLAAVVPVRNVTLVARGGQLVAEPNHAAVDNGGFEVSSAHTAAGYRLQDRPGRVTYIDREVFADGGASLRMEQFDRSLEYHARVMQVVDVEPFRAYRAACWVKTEALSALGGFRIDIRAGDGRVLMPGHIELEPTADWQRVAVEFSSLENRSVRLTVGVFDGRGGRAWVDGIAVEDVGLQRLVDRRSAPLVIADTESGRPLTADVDYRLRPLDCDAPQASVIDIIDRGRVEDGARYTANGYHAMPINDQQGVCMAEPAVHEIWREALALVDQHLSPQAYLLDMDEVRQAGWCEACRGVGGTAGEILVECLQRQRGLIREQNPDAEVWVWSDMIDPNHNARSPYHQARGGYESSWQGIPDDFVIVCWRYETRSASLAHFAALGYETIAAGYYDTGNLNNPLGWIETVRSKPSNRGFMYTTWGDDYRWLEAVGALIAETP